MKTTQTIKSRVTASPRVTCLALNRLIVAGRNEVIAFDGAARLVGGQRRARLGDQIKRRAVFQHDLADAVIALGGTPAEHASGGARLAAGARSFRELLIGPHEGDAYDVCARTTEKAAAAYAKALRLALPADVSFGLEHQLAELECDRSELRRLRWGANPSAPSGERGETRSERPEKPSSSALDDTHALESWSEDGGAGPAPTVPRALPA